MQVVDGTLLVGRLRLGDWPASHWLQDQLLPRGPACRGVTGRGEHLKADAQRCLYAQAHDNDQPGTNNSRLYFSLLPSPYSHNFSVDPDTGLLRNLGPLDREAIQPALGGRIVLTVRVADCGMPVLCTEVNVSITVEVRPGAAGGMGPRWARTGGS